MTWVYVFEKEHIVIEQDLHAILDLKIFVALACVAKVIINVGMRLSTGRC